MPIAQVMTFQAMAPHSAPKITRGSTMLASTMPVPMVVATCRPKNRKAMKLKNAAHATAPKPSGQSLPAKVSFIDAPSSERPEARQKRLKRECKGRPNAGACLGHTR